MRTVWIIRTVSGVGDSITNINNDDNDNDNDNYGDDNHNKT